MAQWKAEVVMTTEKDALKLRRYLQHDDPFWALVVEAAVTQGEAELQNLLQDLFR
jgi:tetraacyldisaccharide-1-P 4'-kinase